MCSLQQIQATDCQEAVQKRQDTAAEATDTHSAGPEVVRHGGLCLLLPGALSSSLPPPWLLCFSKSAIQKLKATMSISMLLVVGFPATWKPQQASHLNQSSMIDRFMHAAVWGIQAEMEGETILQIRAVQIVQQAETIS